ncbi:hypothetical protein HMPREF1531_02497 [Propionibacterium sp. oral taxon 192 str. F0372]|uniref:DUF3145 domain-containing protein n=1 Tax=Propionibacterium sp. oral taxon 192 TaxID=671222 RepID=UPI00035398E6|nr:DUF3145 domain-containing protein [Propionibacterium sp. oral taxon 192]EPH00388.1 hypothetical protein HMPREF1531_02497 [Propionibacterium sp. oral taxon 192 str. F0372]
MPNTATGVVYIHSTPAVLRPHVEWAIANVIGTPVRLEWANQPAQQGTVRAELCWRGPIGTGARLASALRACERIRFEVTEDNDTDLGHRYAWTPSLGLFCAQTSANGDIQIPENRIRKAMSDAAAGGVPLKMALADLLGDAWDDELEVFRYAGADAPVRWLGKVG